ERGAVQAARARAVALAVGRGAGRGGAAGAGHVRVEGRSEVRVAGGAGRDLAVREAVVRNGPGERDAGGLAGTEVETGAVEVPAADAAVRAIRVGVGARLANRAIRVRDTAGVSRVTRRAPSGRAHAAGAAVRVHPAATPPAGRAVVRPLHAHRRSHAARRVHAAPGARGRE